MHTAATSIFNRLTEVEKISIRAATPDGLEFKAHSTFLGDMVIHQVAETERSEVMSDVSALCWLQFSARSAECTF